MDKFRQSLGVGLTVQSNRYTSDRMDYYYKGACGLTLVHTVLKLVGDTFEQSRCVNDSWEIKGYPFCNPKCIECLSSLSEKLANYKY